MSRAENSESREAMQKSRVSELEDRVQRFGEDVRVLSCDKDMLNGEVHSLKVRSKAREDEMAVL